MMAVELIFAPEVEWDILVGLRLVRRSTSRPGRRFLDVR
jgi:hypothetical protein